MHHIPQQLPSPAYYAYGGIPMRHLWIGLLCLSSCAAPRPPAIARPPLPTIVTPLARVPLYLRGHLIHRQAEIAAYIDAVQGTLEQIPNGEIRRGPVVITPRDTLWRRAGKDLERVPAVLSREAIWVEWSTEHGARYYGEMRCIQARWATISIEAAKESLILRAHEIGLARMLEARKAQR